MPATAGEHLLTVLCGGWMTIGLFLDGYFHQNLEGTTESFVTPWHAVFYSGFAASAFWIGSMSRRRHDGSGGWRLRHLPPGYEGARTGLALFAAGAIGDGLWHTALGVERGIDALLSPTHLLIFLGLVLILTAPVRAALTSPMSRPSPWMAAASLTSAVALVAFFLNFVWGLGIAALARVPYDPVSEVGERAVIAGVASTVVTTIVLFGAARLLVAAGPPPPGAFVVLFGLVALLVSAAFDEDIEGIVAAIVAGAALEVLHRASWLRMAPAVGGAAAVLWLVYFGLLRTLDGIAWQPEVWIGAIVFNGLAAAAVTWLPAPSVQEVAR